MAAKNFKTAWTFIWSAKWRSMLTVSGIVIGIVSVVTIVSLGEGVKHQVIGQVNSVGSDLISIRPGKLVTRDASGNIDSVNLSGNLFSSGGGSLSDEDVRIAANAPNVRDVVPIGLLNTTVKVGGKEFDNVIVVGTSSGFSDELVQKMAFGSFFTTDEESRQVAVVSQRVGEELFQENVSLGRQLFIRGEPFVVRGITEPFGQAQLSLRPDFNRAVFIPYPIARELSDNSLQLVQILVRPKNPSLSADVSRELNSRLSEAHGGQHDFTILSQDEDLQVTKSVLDLFTALIVGIAALSLLAGGVGIMNIMLLSVTERTREIGIRKAVGATNRQILGQFLAESTLLSLFGGVLGVICAFLLNGVLHITTNLQPVITLQIVAIACGVSLIIGIIFGLVPAVRAARKDPIDALRSE